MKTTINPSKKNDSKYFKNVTALVLNHKAIGKDSRRITKTKPFVDRYN